MPSAHLVGMTVSMRVMSAGDGYEYLLRTVAAGDGDRSLSTPLTRYYTEEGTPPGFWMGSGLPYLGGGELTEGGRVSEAQLQLLPRRSTQVSGKASPAPRPPPALGVVASVSAVTRLCSRRQHPKVIRRTGQHSHTGHSDQHRETEPFTR